MASGPDDSTPNTTLRSFVGTAIGVRNLVLVIGGVLAGYSIGVLSQDAAVVPLAGSVPSTAVGAVGLAVAAAVSRRWGRCECGDEECGCGGACGDSCSYDP